MIKTVGNSDYIKSFDTTSASDIETIETDETLRNLAKTGAVKFGVDKKSGRGLIIYIPDGKLFSHDPDQYMKIKQLWDSGKLYATPREAEQATTNKGPTRSIPGILAGNIAAPRSQYTIGGADPIRKLQRSKAADLSQDLIHTLGTYGPIGLPVIFDRQLMQQPLKRLLPGAALAKMGTTVANNLIGLGRDDELYNETIPNAALTAGADVGALALYKRFGSKREQIRRELDDLIRTSMRIPKTTEIPASLRDAVKRSIDIGVPFTFEDWAYEPIDKFKQKYPNLPNEPVVFDKFTLPMQTAVKPVKHGAVISSKIAERWAQQNNIDINHYGLENITKGLNEMYSGTDRVRDIFWPRKESKNRPFTQSHYTKLANELYTDNPFLHDMISNRVHIANDNTLDIEWAKARKDFGQRSGLGKQRIAIRDATQTSENVGASRGKKTQIVTAKQASEFGKSGKVKRSAAKLGSILLPIATELFGRELLKPKSQPSIINQLEDE